MRRNPAIAVAAGIAAALLLAFLLLRDRSPVPDASPAARTPDRPAGEAPDATLAPGAKGAAPAAGLAAADSEERHDTVLLATTAAGDPVAGVAVEIVAADAEVRAGDAPVEGAGTTDAAGRVRLALRRGSWRARVRHERYHSEVEEFAVPAAAPVPLRLFRGVPLRVRVRDREGVPVAGARVTLLEFGFGRGGVTDADGIVDLGAVHPTWEALVADAPGYLEEFVWALGRWKEDPSEPLDVRLLRGAPLTVRVVRAGDGAPEEGASVWAAGSGGDARGTTGADGVVRFDAGAHGATRIIVTTKDGRTAQVDPIAKDLQPLDLRVEVPAGRTVTLVAVRADRSPVEGAVVLRKGDEGWTEWGRTDREGRVRLERARGKPGDDLPVLVRAEGLAASTVDVEDDAVAAASGDPDAEELPTPTGTYHVVLLPTVTWVGRVVDAAGKPVAGAVVSASEPNLPLHTRPAEARTDADGRWRIEDVPAWGGVVALAEHSALGLAASDEADDLVRKDGVVTVPDLVLPGTFTLDVPVVDERGEPVPLAVLQVRQRVRTQGERVHWRTAEKGRFHPVTGLSRPFVGLEVSAVGFLPDALRVGPETERLVVERPCRVRGRIVRPDGTPLTDAKLRLHAKDRLYTLEGNAAAATTNAQGAFECSGIRRGRYDVEVAGSSRAVVTVLADGQDLGDVTVDVPR